MLRLRYLTVGFAVLAAACNDSPTGPTTSTAPTAAAITQDVADLAADGAAEDIGVMTRMDGTFPAWAMASFVAGGGPGVLGCNYTAGHFVCARERQNGLDVDREVTFLDADGASQAAYHNRTTASIHVIVTVSGEIVRGPMTATISRHRDFVVSGLFGQETTRTVNGTGSEETSRAGQTRDGKARGYSVSGTSSAVAVVFPVHSEDSDPWPLSGTATRSFTITPLNGTPTTRTVVINFNGTSSPTGTVNGEPFTFDLTQRHAAKR